MVLTIGLLVDKDFDIMDGDGYKTSKEIWDNAYEMLIFDDVPALILIVLLSLVKIAGNVL